MKPEMNAEQAVPMPKTAEERIVRSATVNAVQRLPIRTVTLENKLDKKTAEDVVRSFSTIENVNDGRVAVFSIATVGKILRHRGYDVSKIIKDLPDLYKTSLYGWSEPEVLKAGHKEHSNIKGYHNYINKFTDGTDVCYIRFTLSEENVRRGKIGRNIIHSSAISDVDMYRKGDVSRLVRDRSPVVTKSSPFIDRKLQTFFESVNYKNNTFKFKSQ